MIQQIKIGGKNRPISFGWAVAYDYEFHTGGNYNQTVIEILEEVQTAAIAAAENDLMKAAKAISVKKLTDIVYYGLLHAHRQQHIDIAFDVYDVAEWLFSDPELRGKCALALMETMPKGDAEGQRADTAKKKPTARPGSTGKALSKRRQPSA